MTGDDAPTKGGPWYGKYRGVVVANVDDAMLGRLLVEVPAVLGVGRPAVAMPCAPFAGETMGLAFVPPVGANVWVEFEGGDPSRPIVAGYFWTEGTLPLKALAPGVPVPFAPGFSVSPFAKAILQLASYQMLFSDNPEEGFEIMFGEAEAGVAVSSVRITPAGVIVRTAASTLTVNEAGVQIQGTGVVEIAAEDSTITVTPAQLVLSSAEAVVALGAEGVSVNEGALEVI